MNEIENRKKQTNSMKPKDSSLKREKRRHELSSSEMNERPLLLISWTFKEILKVTLYSQLITYMK